MNRSEFLVRQLRYYASMKSPHPVYIGDAGNQEHRERLERAVDELQNQIKIHYHHWPKLNDRKTIKRLGELTKEDYCAFTGDDDFLIPDSLSKCAEFLEKNPDYRTAQGKGAVFSLEATGPYGAFSGLGPYGTKNESLYNTASERITHFAQNYWVPQFSVHRREEYVEDNQIYSTITDSSFGEIFHCFTFISKGKSKLIDCLYLIRQGHDDRYVQPTIIDKVLHPDWQLTFQLLLDSVSDTVVKEDRVSLDEAKVIVKKVFSTYFEKAIKKRYGRKINCQQVIRKWIKSFWIMKIVLNNTRIVRSKFTAKTGEMLLSSVLDKSSPYNKDFMPIYDLITNRKKVS